MRVVLPISMMLAQAAIESGWGCQDLRNKAMHYLDNGYGETKIRNKAKGGKEFKFYVKSFHNLQLSQWLSLKFELTLCLREDETIQKINKNKV